MNEQSLFFAALDLPDSAARAAYLDEACAGDRAQRRRVEELLRAHAQAGNFLAKPAVELGGADTSQHEGQSPTGDPQPAKGGTSPGAEAGAEGVEEGPGRHVGPYKLLQRIGE